MPTDNIGMTEELVVEMVDCTPRVTVTREWMEALEARLKSIVAVPADEILLDALVQDVHAKLNQ